MHTDSTLGTLWQLITHIGDAQWRTIALGLILLVVLAVLERFARRLPGALVVLVLGGVAVAKAPMYGTSCVVPATVPHVSGLAIGASAPPLNFSLMLLNGCSGFSENVAVSRPVVSLGVTEPFRRTETP